LICRQPPASVASALTPQKPIVMAPSAPSGTSRTIEFTVVLANALTALSVFHPVTGYRRNRRKIYGRPFWQASP
jgi:hypothetical protein